MRNTCLIIPARMTSTRFPGKALIDLCGKSMIYRVWEKCSEVVPKEDLFIATDSDEIKKHCEDHGMNCIMTGNCDTGTDRVAEAYLNLKEQYETIVNVQGDEPLVRSEDIAKVIKFHKLTKIVCCGMCRIFTKKDAFNPNIIKIVVDVDDILIYASRGLIPANKKMEYRHGFYFKQVCIYAFSPGDLIHFSSVMQGYLEHDEEIEFLRFIEYGRKIKMVEVSSDSISVDIPEDADRVRDVLRNKEELCKNF